METAIYEPADIEIYIRGLGMVQKEKSLLAVNEADGRILAVGTEVVQMAGENAPGVRLLSPLRRGKIEDYAAAVSLFMALLDKTLKKRAFRKPSIAVCVPKGLTQVEKKAQIEALYQAGAGKVTVSEQPAQQYAEEIWEHSPKSSGSFDAVIGITKDSPRLYVQEALRELFRYATEEGISREEVLELLQEPDRGAWDTGRFFV